MLGKRVYDAPEEDNATIVPFKAAFVASKPGVTALVRQDTNVSVPNKARAHDKVGEALPKMVICAVSVGGDIAENHLHVSEYGRGDAEDAMRQPKDPANVGVEGVFALQV